MNPTNNSCRGGARGTKASLGTASHTDWRGVLQASSHQPHQQQKANRADESGNQQARQAPGILTCYRKRMRSYAQCQASETQGMPKVCCTLCIAIGKHIGRWMPRNAKSMLHPVFCDRIAHWQMDTKNAESMLQPVFCDREAH